MLYLNNLSPTKIKLSGTIILSCVAVALWLDVMIPTLNVALMPILFMGLYALTELKFPYKPLFGLVYFVTVVVGFFIAIYRPSEFNYPLVLQAASLYDGGQPYSLFVNTSKAMGGYLVVLMLLNQSNIQSAQRDLPRSLIVTTLIVAFITLVACLVFNVGWEPKIPDGLLIFIAVNLGVTVLAEEAFFRLLIQKQIASFFTHKKMGVWVAAFITTILFTLSHTASIGPAFALYLIAGAGYSFVYAYTNRLSMAIAVHFGVNILHFLLLEYPLSL